MHGHKHTFNQNTANKTMSKCQIATTAQGTIPNTVVEIYAETLLKNPVLASEVRLIDTGGCINFSVPHGVRIASYISSICVQILPNAYRIFQAGNSPF